MKTCIFTHPACLKHDTGYGHPESVERLQLTLEALRGPEFSAIEWREAPRAETGQLSRVHKPSHIGAFFSSIPKEGKVQLDANDTVVVPGTEEAALRAAGSVIAAVDAVARGDAKNAFCAVRPPGHHAESDRIMGFCFFNNVAVGAFHARAAHGYTRVAVVDFDVHHGNGTQEAFYHDRDFFFGSTHQAFIFPNTGSAEERGVGNIVNVPLKRGAGSNDFRTAMDRRIFPALNYFRPDFILISAGFDAHLADPVGDLKLDENDFNWATYRILNIAAKHCQGRVVSVLEGGYEPRVVANCAAAHVATLMSA